jgi:hypothetical protein
MLAQVSAIQFSNGEALNLYTSDTTETPPQPQYRHVYQENRCSLLDGNI